MPAHGTRPRATALATVLWPWAALAVILGPAARLGGTGLVTVALVALVALLAARAAAVLTGEVPPPVPAGAGARARQAQAGRHGAARHTHPDAAGHVRPRAPGGSLSRA